MLDRSDLLSPLSHGYLQCSKSRFLQVARLRSDVIFITLCFTSPSFEKPFGMGNADAS
jgi:hypothetical protein